MFYQNADKALERTEESPVYRVRPVFLPVPADVVDVKPLGEVEVHLDGAALPFASNGVFDLDVNLGPVKNALTRINGILYLVGLQRVSQRFRREVPVSIRAHRLLRSRGEIDVPLLEADAL